MEQHTCKSSPIGGYFELELPRTLEFHVSAIALNSGRFCLEYILRCRKFHKVFVPYYTCDSVLEPIKKLGIEYEFYHIDTSYHIADEITLAEGETLIYTNYWGLQNQYCEQLASKYGQRLILDFTQAFFSSPIANIDTFYSCRKFFGVPDGGYLYTDAVADFDIIQDASYMRMDSLIKRIDLSPAAGYNDFQRISNSFQSMNMTLMSRLTKRLMRSIDYSYVAQRRLDNYNILRKSLGGRMLNYGEVPLIFPFESKNGPDLRKILIDNEIYVAKYWPNVEEWAGPDSIESWLANNILPLPIDQRYGEKEMNRIINILK